MKSRPNILENRKECETYRVVNNRPNGRGIGSQLGMGMALQNAGNRVVVEKEDGGPNQLRFLDRGPLVRRCEAPQVFDRLSECRIINAINKAWNETP